MRVTIRLFAALRAACFCFQGPGARSLRVGRKGCTFREIKSRRPGGGRAQRARRPHGGEPERGTAGLHGLRVDVDAGEAVAATGVVEGTRAPGAAQDGDPLLGQRHAIAERDAVKRGFVVPNDAPIPGI